MVTQSSDRSYRVRPMPADFAERAGSGVTVVALMEHYHAGAGVMRRWLDEYGNRPRAKRHRPADFAEHAQRETVVQLIQRYRCGTRAITNWRRELGLEPVTTRKNAACAPPEGFALVAPGMTMRDLKARYGKGKTTIWKWCQRANVQPRKASTHPPRKIVATTSTMGRPKAAPVITNRDTSRAGMAADYLRRFGPVVRCNPTGAYDPKGNRWRRGSTVLCADEVIARAIRNGWNPDAWKALAA